MNSDKRTVLKNMPIQDLSFFGKKFIDIKFLMPHQIIKIPKKN